MRRQSPEAGCVCVTNDGRPMTNTELMRRAMEYAWDLGLKFTDHCEDDQLAPGYLMNEGEMSAKLGVMGQPVVGEAIQVARDIMLSEYLDIPVHIAHVSCAMAVDVIRRAKERGVKVTAETCTHYLMLDETELAGYNTLAKVNPPLRTARDREAMRKAVKDGVIDIIVTDHAPHAEYEKNTTLDQAPNGFIGLELSLPLVWELVREGILKHNVKFIFEGEEEIGSPSLNAFLKEHKELLKADVILVSDTSMLGKDLPSLTTGLRGLAYWEIEVTGPNRDLHSGHFGGAVANPINVLCGMIDKITDEDGRITIPHFYDNVEDVPAEEREMIANIPFDEEKYKNAIGVKALKGEKGYSTLERNSCRPSFDVCGIWGGYTGEGSKTVLPSKAYAKVSCRLVPHQNHEKISKLFVDYINKIAPEYVQVKVTPMHGGEGYVCPISLPAYKAAEKGFEKAFGKKPLAVRRGGSIPIISDFEQILGIKTVLMGFGLESNAIHSPNENFPLDIFRKGIEAVVEFHKEYSSQL